MLTFLSKTKCFTLHVFLFQTKQPTTVTYTQLAPGYRLHLFTKTKAVITSTNAIFCADVQAMSLLAKTLNMHTHQITLFPQLLTLILFRLCRLVRHSASIRYLRPAYHFPQIRFLRTSFVGPAVNGRVAQERLLVT